jgi:hypothetical protein
MGVDPSRISSIFILQAETAITITIEESNLPRTPTAFAAAASLENAFLSGALVPVFNSQPLGISLVRPVCSCFLL